MLKLEPREAARLVLPSAATVKALSANALRDSISVLRNWRHYAAL